MVKVMWEFRKGYCAFGGVEKSKIKGQNGKFGKMFVILFKGFAFGVCSFSVSKTPGILSDSFNG